MKDLSKEHKKVIENISKLKGAESQFKSNYQYDKKSYKDGYYEGACDALTGQVLRKLEHCNCMIGTLLTHTVTKSSLREQLDETHEWFKKLTFTGHYKGPMKSPREIAEEVLEKFKCCPHCGETPDFEELFKEL